MVTGVGVVSPLGLTAGEHFAALRRGESAVRLVADERLDGFPCRLHSTVLGFEPKRRLSNRMLRKLLPPSAQYAVDAGGQALRSAGLLAAGETLEDCGVFAGSVQLEIDAESLDGAIRASVGAGGELDLGLFATRGLANLDPLFLIKALPNSGLCGIAIEYGATGHNLNLSDGPSSGLLAVSLAAGSVADGSLDVAVAGGYDSLLHLDDLMGHLILERLSLRQEKPERACRPFDRARDGYAISEGAAFFVLEELEHARSRGARILVEVLGAAENEGGGLEDAPSLEECARLALERASCPVGSVAAVLVDGVATERDDLLEARAVAAWLGRGSQTPVVADTGALGFAGTASPCFSLASATLGMAAGELPGTLNCDDRDPRCPVRVGRESLGLDAGSRLLVATTDQGRKNVAVVVGGCEDVS